MRPVLLLVLVLSGCATARPLVPVGAGRWALEASVPGVLAAGDTWEAPLGMLLLGARYGVSDALEARARVNVVTPAKGILELDGGAVYHVRSAQGLSPGLHLTGDLSLLTSPAHVGDGVGESVRGATTLGVLGDVAVLPWLRPYVAVDQTLVLYDGAYILTAVGGAQFSFGRFELSVEAGVAGLNHRTREYTEPYVGLAGRGAVWLSWGLAYRLGAAAEER